MTSYWGTPVMFDPEITRDGELGPAVRVGPRRAVVDRRQPPRASASPTRPCRTTTSRRRSASYDTDGRRVPERRTRLPDLRPDGARLAAHPVDVPRSARPRLGGEGRHDRRAGRADRHRPGGARGDGRALQRARRRRARTPTSAATGTASWRPASVTPIVEAPFYAVRDPPRHARHQRWAPPRSQRPGAAGCGGGVVGGLYAAGNTAANVFGWAYPSGGGTLGNGLVFGFLAGRHAAAQPRPRHLTRAGSVLPLPPPARPVDTDPSCARPAAVSDPWGFDRECRVRHRGHRSDRGQHLSPPAATTGTRCEPSSGPAASTSRWSGSVSHRARATSPAPPTCWRRREMPST